ncbi:MAG: hypothetical protein ILO34_07365, partial [Kiritimatiellae bacterium]|nr:hypothetical protein [Kiritimatiellia bacterium]
AYSGLMRESEASKAEVVIAQAKSALATSALERGQKVIAIGRADGEPNTSLGWWFMGKQVGTALADSPVFGELPKDPYLTKLFFRILKTGQKLPLPGLDDSDVFMLGEGGNDMFLYLGQARCGNGKVLMANGLDLLAPVPEAVCLLDGMIGYALGDAFEPEGEIDIPAVKEYSGWKQTLYAPDTYGEHLPPDVGQLSMARGDGVRSELRWLSRPVPENAKDSPFYAFEFKGGMGYRSEPPVSAAIFMNGEKMADIPDFTWEDAEWEGEKATLKYVRDRNTDELGTFTLCVPSGMLEPGECAELCFRVEAGPVASQRWIGICEP